MIKLLYCIRRLPALDVRAFRRELPPWTEASRRLAEAAGARDVTVHTTLAVQANELLMDARGTAEPFDLVLEMTFGVPGPDALAALRRPEAQAVLAEMSKVAERLFDHSASSLFFTSSEEIPLPGAG